MSINLNIMSDFYLLDTYGAYRQIAIHPYLEVLAYDTGCMVIVWNTKTDAKLSLLKHEYEIVTLQFIESYEYQQELLMSIDSSGLGCLWDIDSGASIHEFRFSTAQHLSKVKIT